MKYKRITKNLCHSCYLFLIFNLQILQKLMTKFYRLIASQKILRKKITYF